MSCWRGGARMSRANHSPASDRSWFTQGNSVAEYAVTFSRPARKELQKLPPQLVERVFPKIESLVHQPRPAGCKKLQGAQNLWRIRVGDYRVVYSVDDSRAAVDIVAVRHRSEAYQD